MSFLEKIVGALSPQTYEKIRAYLEDKRDNEARVQRAYEILREKGVKTRYEAWLGDEDWRGNQREYSITPYFGEVFFDECSSRLCIVPVRYYRSAGGDEWHELYLVDLREKSAKTIAESGQRDIHYQGHLTYKPFAIRKNSSEEKVSVAFSTNLRPHIRDIFSHDFWYFLRVNRPVFHKEKTIVEVKLPLKG
ncbi:hypothetical protein FJZ18_00130 [Candidatus Pacearchaeota archaeon]|nr:hypothetical protein [Candidatus Pacearchaeota archaeon]